MKAILKYDLDKPEDQELHYAAINGLSALSLLREITQEIFRPARKHGYADDKLNKLIEKAGDYTDGDGDTLGVGEEIISILEDKFYDMLKDAGLDLDY